MIGGAIVRALLADRQHVRILARDPRRARALFGSSVDIVAGDCRHETSLRRACHGIEDLYHAAAIVGFRNGMEAEILETNVEGTRRLLTAARAAGVARFVYTSSVAVYGDRLPRGVTEVAPLRPSDMYGISKVRAERLVRKAVQTGLRAMIIRPCIVYGPGDRYFLPQASWAMRLPLVPLPDHGRHVVDVVHADEVAAAHLLVMKKGVAGELYNLADGRCYEVQELLRWIAEALRRSPWFPSIPRWVAHTVVPFARLAGRLGDIPGLASLRQPGVVAFFSDYHFNISKIASLGFVSRIPARSGLRRALTGRGWDP
jgi:dihydroflavonol-4-reductase